MTERHRNYTVYLGLGANLGDRAANIAYALRELHQPPTLAVTSVSSLYETAPVGMTEQPEFLNAAARVETTLGPGELLAYVLSVEKSLGRVRTERWGPRVIDIDILLYGDCQIEQPGLSVPHPRLTERAFALVPLAEIAPTAVIAGTGRTVGAWAESLALSGYIRRFGTVDSGIP